MKVRSGFVSNSSSSSFIVPIINEIKNIDYSQFKQFFKTEDKYLYDSSKIKEYSITLPIPEGNKDFGWEVKRYSDFINKLNYLFIQIESLDNSSKIKFLLKNKLENALESICEKSYNLSPDDRYTFRIRIDYNYINYDSIYDWDDTFNIDHQSTWYENLDYVEKYFNINEPNLNLIENYLVGDSYIQGGNDNENMPEEYHDSFNIYKKYIGDF